MAQSKSFIPQKNGKGFMKVPMGMNYLPQGTNIVQRKESKRTYSKNGEEIETYDVYILACGPKRWTGKKSVNGTALYVQNWYVARKVYFGGKPAYNEYLYKGTDVHAARKRFAEIPYNKLYVKLPDNVKGLKGSKVETQKYNGVETRWATYTSDNSYGSIVAARVTRRSPAKPAASKPRAKKSAEPQLGELEF